MAAANCYFKRALYFFAYQWPQQIVLSKKPYIPSKEPSVPSGKSRYILQGYQKSPIFCQKNLTLRQKSPIFRQKSPVFLFIQIAAADSTVIRAAFCRALLNWEVGLF